MLTSDKGLGEVLERHLATLRPELGHGAKEQDDAGTSSGRRYRRL